MLNITVICPPKASKLRKTYPFFPCSPGLFSPLPPFVASCPLLLTGTCLPLCPSFWTLDAVFPPHPGPPPPDPPLLYLALVCSQGWRQLGQGGWWNASVPIPYPWGQTRAKWQQLVSHLPPLLTLDTCNPKAEEINHGS